MPASPPHSPVLNQLGSAHGRTPQVRQAGASPIAAEAAKLAQPPGSRAGLGYSAGSSDSQPSPLPQPLLASASPAQPALPDESPFGGAVEYMQDYSDLGQDEIHKVVLAVKAHYPTEYAASLGASRAGDIPGALKLILHRLGAQRLEDAGRACVRAFDKSEVNKIQLTGMQARTRTGTCM